MADVVQALAEEMALTDLELYTGVIEQREHFFNVLDVVFDLVR